MTTFKRTRFGGKEITFTNDFHNSEAVCFAKCSGAPRAYYLTKGQVARARKKLCGIEGCVCAQNIIGERTFYRSPIKVIENQDGSADIYIKEI